MSNHGNDVSLVVYEINKNTPIIGLSNLFELDNDFTENEDYFREDTLKLGFSNEAERVISELVALDEKDCLSIEEMVEYIINCNPTGGMRFLLSNDGYCGGYAYELTELENSDIMILSVAYIS